MARILRASFVLLVVCASACRFHPVRSEAILRRVTTAILNTAAEADPPATPAAQPLLAEGPAAPAAEKSSCPSLRVAAVRIAPASLRPATEIAEPLFKPVAVPIDEMSRPTTRFDIRTLQCLVERARAASAAVMRFRTCEATEGLTREHC